MTETEQLLLDSLEQIRNIAATIPAVAKQKVAQEHFLSLGEQTLVPGQKFADFLMEMHEHSNGHHNHFQVAANEWARRTQHSMSANAQPAPSQQAELMADVWDEAYKQGVDDERTSEANIGIAGFGAKVEPARVNPYRNAVRGIKKD